MKVGLAVPFVLLACAAVCGQTQYKVLWNFGSVPNDGGEPVGSLIFDKNGNLYGTTQLGGANCCFGPSGTVFELSPQGNGTWSETILYSFCSQFVNGYCLDGASPRAGLILDSAGNLYGTTYGGGAYDCGNAIGGCGTVFQLSPPSVPGAAWSETVLYDFCPGGVMSGCKDGAIPTSQLMIDTSGNLYGTTTTGGTGGFSNICCAGGTVFELAHRLSGWTQSVLYNFCASGQNGICPDGSGPQAGVIFDSSGNLYGTTERGGSKDNSGPGTLYKLSPGTNGWTETVLVGPGTAPKGGGPLGGVALGKSGDLYSTFSTGGAGNVGGAFRYNPKNGLTTRFSFNGPDGEYPSAGLLLDVKDAALYGTTKQGGSKRFYGTIFQIVAPAQETVLYNFCSQPSCTDGEGPLAALIEDRSGNLYGVASGGGMNGQGVVFEVTPR